MNRKHLENLLVIGGPTIILLGIIKYSYFYYYFNIEIIRFMELSEVVGAFIPDLILYSGITIVSVMISIVLENKKRDTKSKRTFINYSKITEFEERVIYLIKKEPRYFYWVLLYFITAYILEYCDVYFYHTFYIFAILSFSRTIFILILFEYKRKIWTQNKLHKKNEEIERYIEIIYFLIYILLTYTTIEVQRVKYEHRYINTEIEFENGIFKSDSTNFYIGHTNKFIFTHNINTNKTLVRKTEDVKQMDFGEIYYVKFKEDEKAIEKTKNLFIKEINITESKKDSLIIEKQKVIIDSTNK